MTFFVNVNYSKLTVNFRKCFLNYVQDNEAYF